MQMSSSSPVLQRHLGLWGAIVLGLGSILGTGVFVSLGIAAGMAGPGLLGAVVIAALVALCNGLSAAQLAAVHPVSGGTYEYGYRYLTPQLGFTAGWLFLLAKSASAATAALGFAGYLLTTLGYTSPVWRVAIALVTVGIMTVIVLGGVRRSNWINTAIVSLTLLGLGSLIVTGGYDLLTQGGFDRNRLGPLVPAISNGGGLLQASAFMFVAYTGYGRIATLGEEVTQPRRTIPLAMGITLLITLLVYLGVAIVGLGTVGSVALSQAATLQVAPLAVVARQLDQPGVAAIVTLAGMTAMLGVLLNLILGLSRVLMAMGRRGDMPGVMAHLNATRVTPPIAVITVGCVVALLVSLGDVKTTWSFSALNVLVYYALTNLATLRIADSDRLYPRWIAGFGLIACLTLAFWIGLKIWLAGLGLIGIGLLVKGRMNRSHP
jgi:APA family basic amino acid/polyamine antiporter